MKYLLWYLLAVALAFQIGLTIGVRQDLRSARAENAALLANIVRQADLKTQFKALEIKLDTVAGDAWEQQQEWKLLEARLNEVMYLARGAACLSAFTLYVMGASDGASAYEYFVRRPAKDCEGPPRGTQ